MKLTGWAWDHARAVADRNENRFETRGEEVIDSLKQIPPDGADYVRGYLQGRLDGIKSEKKEDKE